MLIEPAELTLGHVGLGALTEPALLALCATTQAHRLVEGAPGPLREVADAAGRLLYPGYYWTRLTVPPRARLDRFQVWDRIEIGVEARGYGPLMIDATCAAAPPGELPRDPARWDPAELPLLRSGSMWVVDGTAEPSAPREGAVSPLPRLGAMPEAVARFRQARVDRAIDPGFAGPLATREPIALPILAGRDVAPGRALLFAKYSELMELAEARLLSTLDPPPPARLLVEREVFYYDNCRAGATALVAIAAALAPSEAADCGGEVCAGALSCAFTITEAGSGALCAVARSRELLLVPLNDDRARLDAERLLGHHRAP